MISEKQKELARRFKAMHHNENMFLLPNAWNGGSAKVFEKQGFKAVGTTSAGIAYSMGHSDGENVDYADLKRITKEILNITNIHLTVDLERGYGKTIDEIIENVKQIILLGAVGINIEDGLPSENNVDQLDCFIKKIKAIAGLKHEIEVDFVINARTDIYLLNVGDSDFKLNETITRANALKEAGADCIFIPGSLDEATIIQLRNNIELPINLFVHAAFNDTARLNEIGINRLSSGSAPFRTVFNTLLDVANHFKSQDCTAMLNHEFNYGAANIYFGDE